MSEQFTPDLPPLPSERKSATTKIVMICVGIAILIGLALFLIAASFYAKINQRAATMKQVSNTKQMVLALKVFAIDHDGAYPQADSEYIAFKPGSGSTGVKVTTGRDSTSIYDVLVPDYMPSEKIWWKKNSRDPLPDENGTLDPGENHYSYVGGLDDSARGDLPLVFECPESAGPPLKWGSGKLGRGQAVDGSGVAFAYNDGSAEVIPLKRSGEILGSPDPFAAFSTPGAPAQDLLHPSWP